MVKLHVLKTDERDERGGVGSVSSKNRQGGGM